MIGRTWPFAAAAWDADASRSILSLDNDIRDSWESLDACACGKC